MTVTIDELLAEFADELQQMNQRYARFAKRAEEGGFTQLSKFFRALTASDRARSKLTLAGMNAHAEEKPDFFVCPQCGLVYMLGTPEKCPVDGTEGTLFEKIS